MAGNPIMSRLGGAAMPPQGHDERYDEMLGSPAMGLVYLPFVFLPLGFWP